MAARISSVMKLTILQTGEVPLPLRSRFVPYRRMFETMFDKTGQGFSYQTINVAKGEPFPDPGALEGVVITGSAAGVYDDLPWLEPLRDFIRRGYQQRTPLLGICFGHQIMADALGGDVRKSPKGWGLGRHTYQVTERPDFMPQAAATLAVACSHQDQVLVPPSDAKVILASDFTPNAGLAYRNGAALSFQPHPEFEDDYAVALAELRRGKAPDALVDAAIASVATPSHSADVANSIGRFFTQR